MHLGRGGLGRDFFRGCSQCVSIEFPKDSPKWEAPLCFYWGMLNVLKKIVMDQSKWPQLILAEQALCLSLANLGDFDN